MKLITKIKIHGMTIGFIPFQIFGVFISFEMEIFQNGGYFADGVKFEKIKSPAVPFKIIVNGNYKRSKFSV